MADMAMHNPEQIPDGYKSWIRTEVVGTFANENNCLEFSKGKNPALKLVAEPNNKYDNNAIAVYGNFDTKMLMLFPTRKSLILGYLPAPVSAQIVANGVSIKNINVILNGTKMWVGDYKTEVYVKLIIALPVEMHKQIKKKEKEATLALKEQIKKDNLKPALKSQKDMLKLLNIEIPKGLKRAEAEDLLEKHESWIIEDIIADMDDKDNRDDFGIKKVSKTLALECIAQIISNGTQPDEIFYEDVYDLALEKKPELHK